MMLTITMMDGAKRDCKIYKSKDFWTEEAEKPFYCRCLGVKKAAYVACYQQVRGTNSNENMRQITENCKVFYVAGRACYNSKSPF